VLFVWGGAVSPAQTLPPNFQELRLSCINLSAPPIQASSPPLATRDMADKSALTHFRAIFEATLQVYEEQAGITLAKDPLVMQVQNCGSVDDITAMLQGQAKAFADFRSSDRVLKSMKNIAFILSSIFVTACKSLSNTISPVRQNTLVALHVALTLFYSHSHL